MFRALSRSTINHSVEQAMEMFRRHRINLPPFAYWTAEDWMHKGREADEIRDCMLGWDVTDFGLGDFERCGRILFTLRNGTLRKSGYPKLYAEKLIVGSPGQRAPVHFHRTKMEDIICRAGGNVIVRIVAANDEGGSVQERLRIQVDGQTINLDGGQVMHT